MVRSRPWSSLAFRLALSYGGLMVLTMAIVLAVFYVQTVGVVRVRLDKQAENHVRRLMEHSAKYGPGALESEILQTIRDGVNTDTEILILMNPQGETIVSNAEVYPPRRLSIMGVRELTVKRNGRLMVGRVAVVEMPNGNLLAVGSDMQLQRDMEELFGQASLLAAVAACIMALIGAIVFRRVVDERAAAIRSTMSRVAAGELRQRIPVDQRGDEFTLLNRDINTMLDRLEQLMEGIRHVSNSIAHNLRTPLTRILLRLRNAQHASPEMQSATLALVAEEVAELGVVFEKLLQIAEVESGASRKSFASVDLQALLVDVVDFYEPLVEDAGGILRLDVQDGVQALGDGDLLASAVSNLVDNAIKYGAAPDDIHGADVLLRAAPAQEFGSDGAWGVEITVQDQGPGADPHTLEKMTTRFYRAESDRPGYGLGLASVLAIVQLHGGKLSFHNAHPGMMARIWLPAVADV
ncbi:MULTISPECIES: sensor histidine kinase [Comamonas]|jgi:signal transduction histidine kinase|uniref:sensor histidine kinase n=1 Tax=Comamonas TaxID=283 RepID=UPI0012C2C525|nr:MULTISPECIES: HAMP domain-containing sensor histidine kinase [Comamonas]MDR3063975.1 HAMP domain-containing histidine kinase [Comamonas sp.]MEB5966341.1 HAMP domain-containing histidine kinase [Comamonas testosteroni]MPS93455.1 HAMP domain-containing histidine kinase [Comamonas sp.]